MTCLRRCSRDVESDEFEDGLRTSPSRRSQVATDAMYALIFSLCLVTVQGSRPAHHVDEADKLDVEAVQRQLVSDIEHVVRCRRIPGLSVAVVYAGQPVLVRGFGHAKLGRAAGADDRSEPVTEHTKFAVASASKAFTSALIGILLNEHENRYPLRWDTRVGDVMGSNFRFVDELRTRETTIRDLLAHRTGLPSYKMALMVGLEPAHSRQDYCFRMHHMELDESGPTSFRNQFSYNNVMYLVAGCVAERLGDGQPLEQLMKEKLFRPLGMNDTHFISEMEEEGFENDTRLATMYFWNSTSASLEPLSDLILRTVLPLDAAGGVISTAADMTKWLEFQLNAGRDTSGNQLLPVSYWLQMHSAQMALKLSRQAIVRPWFPASATLSAYGLGWRIGSYRGRRKSEHAGHLAAFDCKLTIVHSDRLAVFTANNGPLYAGRDIHITLHFLILDTILSRMSNSLSPWLNQTSLCTFPQPWQSRIPPPLPAVADAPFRPPSTLPTPVIPDRPAVGWLADGHWLYVGRYGHRLLGNFSVSFQLEEGSLDGGTLLFQVGSIGRGRLTYADGLTWLMQFDDLAYFSRFGTSRQMPLPIVFHDQAAATEDGKDGQFQAVVIIPFEPQAPPVFRRNLLWNSVSRSSGSSWLGQLSVLSVALAAMRVAGTA